MFKVFKMIKLHLVEWNVLNGQLISKENSNLERDYSIFLI